MEALAAIAAEREGEPIEKWIDSFRRLLPTCESGEACALVAEVGGQAVAFGKVARFTPPADSPANTAPPGWYLSGVVVSPAWRRKGIGARLTRERLAWIAERAPKAYYFANARNQASIDLHQPFGFVELTRDFTHPKVTFEGGVGILFVCYLGRAMSHDTTPEAARIQAEVVERLGPDARLRLAFQMSEAVRDLARARIRAQNPSFNDVQVRNELVWELYGIRLGP